MPGSDSTTTETPKVGDIVLYVGDNPNFSWSRRRDERAEFIVTQVDEDSAVHAVELHLPEHPKWREKDQILARADFVRVVRRATYLTDEHVQLLSDALTLFWHRAPVRRDEVKALLTAVPTLALDGGDYDPEEGS